MLSVGTRLALLASAGALVLSACVGRGLPLAPVHPEDDEGFSAPQLVVPKGVDSDPAQPLRLMPGDVVQLTTVSAESKAYPGLIVDALGQLHVPLAGDVVVGRLSLGEAERAVDKALRRYDRYVRSNLIITDPAGHTATVLGAVVKPGRVKVTPGLRLADLIAEAGGPSVAEVPRERSVTADLDGARLQRGGKTVPVSIPLAMRGDTRHNIRIQSGDQLYVPPGNLSMIIVLGEVNNPQPVQFRRGIRLTEALSRAGGLNQEGDRRDVRIVRGKLKEPKVYYANLKDVVEGDAPDVLLAPGDIIWVTEHWIATTAQFLDAIAPVLSVGEAAAIIALSNSIGGN